MNHLRHKLHKEKEFSIWGTGNPLREFLYVDDLADAINFLIDKPVDTDLLNVGSGIEISIKDLAYKIKEIIAINGGKIKLKNLTLLFSVKFTFLEILFDKLVLFILTFDD